VRKLLDTPRKSEIHVSLLSLSGARFHFFPFFKVLFLLGMLIPVVDNIV
jgi:hypothetical protein